VFRYQSGDHPGKMVYPRIADKRPADITYRGVQAVLNQEDKAGAKGLADLPETRKRVRQGIKVTS